MMQDTPLSMDQMTALLDNAPVAIYVNAMDTRELLYANRAARRLFFREPDGRGLTCYQAAGFDEPCPFCHTAEMGWDSLCVREYRHPANRRVYQLSGKLIDWAGTPAHIEYIQDITEKKSEEERIVSLKEELQATFSSIPCGLCVYRYHREEITPLFHNPAFYAILGYSEEHIREVEEQTSFLGVHPEDIDGLRVRIQGAVRQDGLITHTYRVWNDSKGEYRHIRLDGSVKSHEEDAKLLYGVYTDVSEQIRLEKDLLNANQNMQDIINAIPGGVAIYKVTDTFETVYFSDGVPALTGYTVEEYRELSRRDAAEMIYREDTATVVSEVAAIIRSRGTADLEFRKQHRDGHVVWVHAQAKWIGEEDGCPLLHCVFHNITDLKQARSEMDHLVNSIPGGIASYRIQNDRLLPVFFSDGVPALSGYTRDEYDGLFQHDALAAVFEPDRERVTAAVRAALASGDVLDVFYRMRHKDGHLIWIHLNGRRMGPLSESMRFYAVFTGLSAETRLFQSIANETADGIYVIAKDTYDLLYVNESKSLFMKERDCLGQKCYAALHGKSGPCGFCTLRSHPPDGEEHVMTVDETDEYYATRFHETDWNGIPAYVKFVRNVTEEVTTRKEKERLEQYFQTIVNNLPGGVAVVRYEPDGHKTPEFLSAGFAAMTGMTLDDAWRLYRQDAMIGVHPDDRAAVDEQMAAYIGSGENQCEIVYRLQKGDGDYIWVKNTLSLIQNDGGESRVYAVYHDMTKEREEKEQLRLQYKELILQHYRAPEPNSLIIGHCNVTQNQILEIIDHTHSDLLTIFGTNRQEFFTGLADLVVDESERQRFLDTYLNAPALAAFQRKDTEQILRCFIKLPREATGRYVQFKVNLVETPDTGDITGILTVTDITEQIITDRILHQLSVTSYDLVIDLDLERDAFTILTQNASTSCVPPPQGSHHAWTAHMIESAIVPKDKDVYASALDPREIRRRLSEQGPYTFAFSITDGNGDIRTKNMTVSAIDLRLGRVCLVRTDITDSIREQQGLLHMIAYTFELAGFIDLNSWRLTVYTRQTVLDSLSPHIVENYDQAVSRFAAGYVDAEDGDDILRQFYLRTMLERLAEKPAGYDFVYTYRSEEGPRYKQINVLWGDQNHRTICLVRADVTAMLAAERQTKRSLENALALAEEANQAKSDFLSAMSHDIRTPMNAIMGMTALAVAHMDDPDRVADCLQKISVSSRHLLSLINDVLDMSKIERSKITLNRMRISLPDLMEQLAALMAPQARAAGVAFDMQTKAILHESFYGDSLRINQILINLLSNAVKFTPEGGSVHFLVEELHTDDGERRVRYRFTVSDTGVGMSEEFLAHIFDPFTRGRAVARVEGTGLGLSIAKGLVDLMGGTISVESRAGKGSVFQVELEGETARPEDSPTASAPDAPAGAEEKTLFADRLFLVAEDNAINAEILCELLAMYGADSVVETDGAQAVQAFRSAKPGTYDAILMDIQMPEMNGYEATRAIREMERPDARDIPIIAMTANAFAEDVQASLAAGMTAHVAKPIDLGMLRAALCAALNGAEA